MKKLTELSPTAQNTKTGNSSPTAHEARAERSRINGAKSQGPTTIEGKNNSSKNSLKHGFAAVINVVLAVEDQAAFLAHVAGFCAGFRPQDYVEQTLVEEMAAIKWRKSRLTALETAIIDVQLSTQEEALNREHPKDAHDPYFHLALAWNALATVPEAPVTDEPQRRDKFDLNSLELIRRYQSSMDRQYRNAQLSLSQYRKDFAPNAQPPAQVPAAAAPEPPNVERTNEPRTSVQVLPKTPPQPIEIRPIALEPKSQPPSSSPTAPEIKR